MSQLHDLNACLMAAQQQAMNLMNQWFAHGEHEHQNQGQAFIFQLVGTAFAFMVGARHLGLQPAEEFKRLNRECGQSPFGFAALDVPPDFVIMHALACAEIFNATVKMRQEGTSETGPMSINGYIREAARKTLAMPFDGPRCRWVAEIANQTDEDMHQRMVWDRLLRETPVGMA